MTTPNSNKGALEEENSEKATTPALEQILEDIKMSLGEAVSEAKLKSPKVRALITSIFPEIEQVLNAGKISLAKSAVKIEGGLENVFEVNTTTFPGKISLFNKNEEGLGFVNKSGERAFDSVLSLGDNFLATKTNGVVVLENLKTGVYIEWSEEPHTIIDSRKYKSKIKQLDKNKAKFEYVNRGNYHNLITVLNSIDTKQKIRLLNEIDHAIGDETKSELVEIISTQLGVSKNIANQILNTLEVFNELYLKSEEAIDKRISGTRYPELRNEVLKSILSESSNGILEGYLNCCFKEDEIKKVLIQADKGHIEIITNKGTKYIDFDDIFLLS